MRKLFLPLVLLLAAQTSSTQALATSDEQIRLAAAKAFEEEHRNHKPATDKVFSRRATCIARSLLEAIPSEKADPGIKWSIYIYEDNAPDVLALPSGHLIINSGIVNVTNGPDELAAAIATPMSGVLLKHVQRRSSRQSHALLIAIVAAATNKATPEQAELARQEQETKDAEVLEADQFARSLMMRAGFTPLSQLTLLERLASQRPAAKSHFTPRIKASREGMVAMPQGKAVAGHPCTLLP